MRRRYVTADVFTARAFGGNPLAVVLDAQGLSTAQMQVLAAEFNYSETTFVLPPQQAGHTAQVRIFTPRVEVPFAGHPNVGTAVVLARDMQERGEEVGDRFVFEETAGLVSVRLLREDGLVVGAELTAPQPLSVGTQVTAQQAADCLGLMGADVKLDVHPPLVCSVGLPFLVVELHSREALRRAKPNLAAHERVLTPAGTDAIYAYCRAATPTELHARTFAPLDGCIEDPATGSATGAAVALLASRAATRSAVTHWTIHQGVDMGRPSLIQGITDKRDGTVTTVNIAGQAVLMMKGQLPEDLGGVD